MLHTHSILASCTFQPPPALLLPNHAVRTFDQRTVLNLFADRITAVSLTGYVFFGRWGFYVAYAHCMWDSYVAYCASKGASTVLANSLPPVCGRHARLWMPYAHSHQFRHPQLPASAVPLTCSSLNVMETVMTIARSTLSSQPHTPAAPVPATHPVAVGEQWGAGSEGQHGQAARSASLRSMPSSGALRRTHETAQQVRAAGKDRCVLLAQHAACGCICHEEASSATAHVGHKLASKPSCARPATAPSYNRCWTAPDRRPQQRGKVQRRAATRDRGSWPLLWLTPRAS